MKTHGKQQQIGLHRRDLITTLTSVSFAVIIDVITTKKKCKRIRCSTVVFIKHVLRYYELTVSMIWDR